MKILIATPDKKEREYLKQFLSDYDPFAAIISCTGTVTETISRLTGNDEPDLLITTTHLADGLSFDVFKKVAYKKPVIFTATDNQYVQEAFTVFCIDYILKPLTAANLASGLAKYKAIMQSLDHQPGRQSIGWKPGSYKKRFLGKVGQRIFFIDVSDIVYFQADNKIVYLVDKENNRYVVNQTMEQLIQVLDPTMFFRLNRRYIVKINAIEQVRPYYNKRLKLAIRGNITSDDMVVSRERVAAFRQWAEA